jgi:hypothetical protein
MSDAHDYGPRPELAWLPVGSLSVDPAYQRTMDSRRSKVAIEAIIANFRWACFGTVLVTSAGDGWLIIDGQHRCEAARRLGIRTVPCIVVPGATPAQQAGIFVATNQVRVQVNPYALYHARLAAKEPAAVALAALLEEAHIEIPRRPIPKAEMKPGQTLALAALEKVVARGNPAARAGVVALGHAYSGVAAAVTALVVNAAALAAEARPSNVNAVGQWFRHYQPSAIAVRWSKASMAGEMALRIIDDIDKGSASTKTPSNTQNRNEAFNAKVAQLKGNARSDWPSERDRTRVAELIEDGKQFVEIANAVGAPGWTAVRDLAAEMGLLAKSADGTWVAPANKAAVAQPRHQPKKRPCMSCGKEFLSEGSHNRLCDGCRTRSVA